ncbi:hypothetical protein [Sabulicella glaciei]|uniref:Uncharacterized protein n=1 Tax=Sabulicella glaciei TaxID=2984948 RepID=A0ABT3P015_9PROT|nr:hypothetical protein [Roseococcus sp. MDT2-1-1]MCW8087752.1 hypothetical protein [Roseococcus sp. MDT2-1-1]
MRRRVLWMNLLFAAGLALILPWFAAGVLAHWWGPARGTFWATQHAYAVRTFWVGVLGLVGGAVSGLWPILVLAWLWCAARVTRQWMFWEGEDWVADPGRFL